MINITGMAHVGVRVADFRRSVRFYENLGFHLIRNDLQERVVVMKHPSGVEINFLDSVDRDKDRGNVLMDQPVRYAGYTHIALRVSNIYQAAQDIRALGIEITEGPVSFGDGSISVFFRDPDRNVIELAQPQPASSRQSDALRRSQLEAAK